MNAVIRMHCQVDLRYYNLSVCLFIFNGGYGKQIQQVSEVGSYYAV